MKLQELRHQLLAIFVAPILALMLHPTNAHAQIIGDLMVSIPFQFHVGSSRLPPGKYVIHMLDSNDLTVMEISSADGSISALFNVQSAQANQAPAKSELIFNKYGNRYFLAELFDEDNADGSRVVESRYEKRMDKTTLEAQEHVPAYRQKG
jgi:hypothetical protein